jgi:hypothetical protein
MMQAEQLSQTPGRRAGIRIALCALMGATLLTSERASAVAVSIATIEWGSVAGVNAYNTFATECTRAGGGGCPTDSPMPNGDPLFSWGGLNNASNSRLTWTNTDPLGSFVLDRIEIHTQNPATLLGSLGGRYHQGVGAAPVWEWSNQAEFTQMLEAMVQIRVGGNDARRELFSGSSADQTWYSITGNTSPTPISFVFDATGLVDKTINLNDLIVFRLYESFWNGQNQNLPDLVFAPMTIEIFGSRDAPVPLPGTLALLGLGLGALRLRRGRSSCTTS